MEFINIIQGHTRRGRILLREDAIVERHMEWNTPRGR